MELIYLFIFLFKHACVCACVCAQFLECGRPIDFIQVPWTQKVTFSEWTLSQPCDLPHTAAIMTGYSSSVSMNQTRFTKKHDRFKATCGCARTYTHAHPSVFSWGHQVFVSMFQRILKTHWTHVTTMCKHSACNIQQCSLHQENSLTAMIHSLYGLLKKACFDKNTISNIQTPKKT